MPNSLTNLKKNGLGLRGTTPRIYRILYLSIMLVLSSTLYLQHPLNYVLIAPLSAFLALVYLVYESFTPRKPTTMPTRPPKLTAPARMPHPFKNQYSPRKQKINPTMTITIAPISAIFSYLENTLNIPFSRIPTLRNLSSSAWLKSLRTEPYFGVFLCVQVLV